MAAGLGISCGKVVCGISPLMARLEVGLGISCGQVMVCGISPLMERRWGWELVAVKFWFVEFPL